LRSDALKTAYKLIIGFLDFLDIIEIANKAYKISVNYNYLEIDFFYLFFIFFRKLVRI